MADAILTLNAGSSSLKFAVYLRGADGLALHSKGQVEGIGAAPHLIAHDAGGKVLAERRWGEGERQTHEDFLAHFLGAVEPYLGAARLVGVGHRIVHGGTRFTEPVRLTPEVMTALDALVPLAPLHQPHNLAAIRAVAALRPGLAQIACFDTAFHHARPDLTTRIALPRALADEAGIRRYGFHGLSYEYLSGALRERVPKLAQRPGDRGASRQRRQPLRHARRKQRGHHNGFYGPRRVGDGHPPRRARPRRGALPDAAARHECGRRWRRCSTSNPACSASPASPATCAR